MRGKPIADDKRAAITAAILAGGSVTSVAEQFDVGKATVSEIKNGLAMEQLEQIRTEKKERIEDLIAGYLRENLRTLAAQSIHARDPHWMDKQGAEAFAILHGVMADKAIRILEAAAAAQPLETQPIENPHADEI